MHDTTTTTTTTLNGTAKFTAVCPTCRKDVSVNNPDDCCVLSLVPEGHWARAVVHQYRDYRRGWVAGFKSAMTLGLIISGFGLVMGLWLSR